MIGRGSAAPAALQLGAHDAAVHGPRAQDRGGDAVALAGQAEQHVLGADEVVVSRNSNEMKKHAGSFDFIIDTVSANHDINAEIDDHACQSDIWNAAKPRRQRRVP